MGGIEPLRSCGSDGWHGVCACGWGRSRLFSGQTIGSPDDNRHSRRLISGISPWGIHPDSQKMPVRQSDLFSPAVAIPGLGEPNWARKSHFLMRPSCPLWGRSHGGQEIQSEGGAMMRSSKMKSCRIQIVSLILAVLIFIPAHAEAIPGRWEKVSALEIASPIKVELKNGDRIQGQFRGLSVSDLELLSPAGWATIPRMDIQTITIPSKDGVGDGAWKVP